MHDRDDQGTGRGGGVGGFTAEDVVRARYVLVHAADQEISLSFDVGEPTAETIGALLPHARAVLAAFGGLRDEAVAFLWEWGADGTEPAAERARFLAENAPTSLVVDASGEFALHYEEIGEGHFLDGYWPAVRFTADLTPLEVTVEA
ncbi:hypothetical protein [Streptomyces sp. NPDC014894]|uniref:hypothetical protein n=1 Tax=Streptomyces sp. NPDC014894 TaxID=3364931 RepID=UPI0036F921F8